MRILCSFLESQHSSPIPHTPFPTPYSLFHFPSKKSRCRLLCCLLIWHGICIVFKMICGSNFSQQTRHHDGGQTEEQGRTLSSLLIFVACAAAAAFCETWAQALVLALALARLYIVMSFSSICSSKPPFPSSWVQSMLQVRCRHKPQAAPVALNYCIVFGCHGTERKSGLIIVEKRRSSCRYFTY